MLPTIKSKALPVCLCLALCVGIGASWSSASTASNLSTPASISAMPQFSFMLEPISAIDSGGGIIIKFDPPELSAVFPVLP